MLNLSKEEKLMICLQSSVFFTRKMKIDIQVEQFFSVPSSDIFSDFDFQRWVVYRDL